MSSLQWAGSVNSVSVPVLDYLTTWVPEYLTFNTYYSLRSTRFRFITLSLSRYYYYTLPHSATLCTYSLRSAGHFSYCILHFIRSLIQNPFSLLTSHFSLLTSHFSLLFLSIFLLGLLHFSFLSYFQTCNYFYFLASSSTLNGSHSELALILLFSHYWQCFSEYLYL